MVKQTFLFTVAFILTLAGTMHIVRAALNWSITINNWSVPLWVSWAVGGFVALLGIRAWYLGIKAKRR